LIARLGAFLLGFFAKLFEFRGKRFVVVAGQAEFGQEARVVVGEVPVRGGFHLSGFEPFRYEVLKGDGFESQSPGGQPTGDRPLGRPLEDGPEEALDTPARGHSTALRRSEPSKQLKSPASLTGD